MFFHRNFSKFLCENFLFKNSDCAKKLLLEGLTNRSLHNNRKWVFCNGTDTHTQEHCRSITENVVKIIVSWTENGNFINNYISHTGLLVGWVYKSAWSTWLYRISFWRYWYTPPKWHRWRLIRWGGGGYSKERLGECLSIMQDRPLWRAKLPWSSRHNTQSGSYQQKVKYSKNIKTVLFLGDLMVPAAWSQR